MIKAIRYLDACLPDFFQGYGGVVLAAPCHAGMTYGDLRGAIAEDANAADYGIEDWTGFDAALAAAFDGVNLSARVDFLDHDAMAAESDADEYGESVYAYFGIEESEPDAERPAGLVESNMSDHDFAAYLRTRHALYSFDRVADSTIWTDGGRVVAVALYDNASATRRTYVRADG